MKQSFLLLIFSLVFTPFIYGNQLQNGDFENDIENWAISLIDPDNSHYLDNDSNYSGDASLCLDIQEVNPNWWENQFYYFSTGMESNTSYEISFYAKCSAGEKQINISLLDNVNFSSYLNSTITINNNWEKYTFFFSAPNGANEIGIYMSVGFEIGTFCFDEFCITEQCNLLVWGDEFEDNDLDPNKWTAIVGPGFNYSEPQYFTDAPGNFNISNGTAKFIAKEEQFMGYDYTSSAIKSEDKYYGKYGKFEARMKMPVGQGLWPAFWLLYQNSDYGPWPISGEIDILEYLGSSPSTAHGTVHYGNSAYTHNYNIQSYTLPAGDLTSDFHTYSIEWNKDKITWFLDGIQYHQFLRSSIEESDIYPFDKPFYIILNLSLGGWEGFPNASTMFPAQFEVDYVKVYQQLDDIIIYTAPTYTYPSEENIVFYAPSISGATYNWILPESYELVSGQGTPTITVNVGDQTEAIQLELTTSCGSRVINHQVNTSDNLCKNGDFEHQYDNWYFLLSDATNFGTIEDQNTFEGNYAACIEIVNPSAPNWWEDHLAYYNTGMTEDSDYTVSFYAKADSDNKQIYFAAQDNQNFTAYFESAVTLTDEWTQFTFDISIPTNVNDVGLYFNIGLEQGTFCFDDVRIEPNEPNLSVSVKNKGIKIFPNPSGDLITIDGNITNLNVKVLNVTGIEVASYSASSTPFIINIDNLPVGLYFIIIEDQNNIQLYSQKLIKK